MSIKENRSEILKAHFDKPNAHPAPIITSLNGDNSWLFSIPVPTRHRSPKTSPYYHIVSDPWLTGPPTTGFIAWLVSFGHVSPPAASSGADIEAICAEIDAAAGFSPAASEQKRSRIGAIIMGQNTTDHVSTRSLATFEPSIPVLAVSGADKAIRGMAHFDTVVTRQQIADEIRDWRSHMRKHPQSPPLLPPWIWTFGVKGDSALMSVGVVAWETEASADVCDAILDGPHGIRIGSAGAQALGQASPPLRFLAMLHPTKESYTLWFRNIYGGASGSELAALIRARVWIPTHDNMYTYSGPIGRLIFEALGDKGKLAGDGTDGKPEIVHVGNGLSYALDVRET
ncbi:uncharacterized protein PgNI_11879 [Pyricularia grisea]|uniref:Uncharacterized protein n=1 Tax=Pyricularia grisea TaxID=148305 RepID=A0A6P8ANQ3_PYRGI|nr:uncharacterized protein PgNI_11879 [Pyricularia grisea]TLD03664.1 hypothetical protein PgNI_11879 [Pyricularia grisea]